MEILTASQEILPQKHSYINISDQIWFLNVSAADRKLQDFKFPGWHASDVFGNNNPVYIEYCSGNGAWIAEKAEANPEENWVAVEYKFSRVRKIWGHTQRRKLKNLFVINGEALEATQTYFPSKSIAGVYINFPDPWPKRRHAKNRVVSPHFVREMARILTPGAKLTFVTDNSEYSESTIHIMSSVQDFKNCFPSPGYILEWPEYGNSFFDSLWREKGLEIRYHQFLCSQK